MGAPMPPQYNTNTTGCELALTLLDNFIACNMATHPIATFCKCEPPWLGDQEDVRVKFNVTHVTYKTSASYGSLYILT